MFQEREFLARNWNKLPVRPRKVDVVLLTHAHIDHCGLLPKLVEDGFRGRVLATAPTAELAALVLRDSAEIQAEDAAFKRKRHSKEGRQGPYPEKPLYTLRNVERTLPLIEPVSYHHAVPITGRVSATFHEAGHILGSAMIEIVSLENDRSRKILFSGDMGQTGKPFVRDPARFTQEDYIVVESTYGDRTHEDQGGIETQLAEAIHHAVAAGGKVIVPIFAIERAQELIYYLGRLVRSGRIPSVPVYLDSPMAASATEIFRRHRDCFAPRGSRSSSRPR